VILVAVRDEHAAHLVRPLEQVAEIGMQQLDAVIVLREGDAAIDDQDRLFRLESEAVHADLTKTAERHDA
jgi:hypothetical protein